ncbi:hypothetical protein EPR50_G00182000 [Perca flavescens]|uniref:G-protein coupled receptors family 1 profile domain-containing protein n=1 Tax=Perca flavescens TaxID=8167 RepID=A0A484CCL2_PERFV|nr:ovarian cancer G-protein coupled receptor 1-like [Perca flavescens]TDH01591.1 hypothetical protein EPR50_G00182000 [Perca flavescens]
MEDLSINDTSQDTSHVTTVFIIDVGTGIIICIGLPLTLMAIYALYSLVGKDNVAPIYVINLLISDLIQFCCMIGFLAQPGYQDIYQIGGRIYFSSLVASVYFMVCIALERYLVIACPLWYRFRRTIKITIVVCVLVWVFPLIFVFSHVFWPVPASLMPITLAILFLLPFPLLIFFLVGTLKSLSASISVQADEKRRIVAMLVMVLVIYTLLFLPRIIMFLIQYNTVLNILSDVFIMTSPLADLVLYIFMRKGAIDKLLTSVCCCRMDRNDGNISTTITIDDEK